MNTRHDKTAYPFHVQHNPRAHITCCRRPAYNRHSWSHRAKAFWVRVQRVVGA